MCLHLCAGKILSLFSCDDEQTGMRKVSGDLLRFLLTQRRFSPRCNQQHTLQHPHNAIAFEIVITDRQIGRFALTEAFEFETREEAAPCRPKL